MGWKLVIPRTPPPLEDALAFVDQLDTRPDASTALPLTFMEWDQAVKAAACKRDRHGLATLLRVQLVPALSRAMVSLAQAVRQAMDAARAVDEDPAEQEFELARSLEAVQWDMLRAMQATWAAELRSGLLPDHAGPLPDRPDALERERAKMAGYLQIHVHGGNVLEAVADDLGFRLRKIINLLPTVLENFDKGWLDSLLAHPLQLRLSAAFHSLSAARMHLFSTNVDAVMGRLCAEVNELILAR